MFNSYRIDSIVHLVNLFIINISKNCISILTNVNDSKTKSLLELYVKLYTNLIELNI